MPNLTLTEAFSRYGAKLKNPQWSVCAESPDGSLVVSLWQHHFALEHGKAIYRDRFDRWAGHGNTELRERLQRAFETNQPLHVVIGHAERPEQIDAGVDASTVRKTFSVREDWVGRVTRIEDEEYEIEFVRR
jgi:hypothetical protein